MILVSNEYKTTSVSLTRGIEVERRARRESRHGLSQ